MTLRIGVDVGGTFTDGLAFDTETGAIFTAKVASTPDPADGFFTALDEVLAAGGSELGFLAHGTTAATNALIEGKVARLALVTNRGFGDILEIGFQNRPDLYDVRKHRAPPLVPRELCFEVAGRIGPAGEEEEPLDAAAVEAVGRRLAELTPRVAAVVVCLLHSYRNDAHERSVASVLGRHLGEGVLVTGSAEVSREFREYPRASTAVVNAAIAPLMDSYLGRVEAGLEARGVRSRLYVMQSNGGLVESVAARRRPAFIIESGPAAAAIAAASIARDLELPRALALDIGGTTAKVALILDGQPEIAPELEVGPRAVAPSRLGRAGGYPLRTPCVDLVEIGAGGGSIAWLDAGGALRVGPRSAGAVPGPACYPEGGEEATLTDANVVLGRIDPQRFLGGRVSLRAEAAERALATLGRGMDRDAQAAAWSVVAVAVDAMAAALRLATVDKGYDPREFSLVALGGAGPLHACEIAASAGVKRVVIPPRPGLGSALGLLATDLKAEAVVSWPGPLSKLDLAPLGGRLEEMEASLRQELARQGAALDSITAQRLLDLRYLGQSFELRIPWPGPDAARLEQMFHVEHRRHYGFAVPAEPVELVALRVAALGGVGGPPRTQAPAAMGPVQAAGRRELITDQPDRRVEALLIERQALGAGHQVEGPALVFDADATTYLPPGWSLTVEPDGNLTAEKDSAGRPPASAPRSPAS
jgi:N-methylhydantoinase A